MPDRSRRWVLGAGLATGLWVQTPGHHVALVYGFLGPPEKGRIRRGDRVLPVELVSPLFPGDQLSADVGGGFEIEYLGGMTVRVTFDQPHTVGAPRAARRSLQAILGLEIGDLWARPRALVGLSDSGSPLRFAIPGLAESGARIGGGVRRLGVDWKGGSAPFTAAFTDPIGRPVVSADPVAEHAVATQDPRVLMEGLYQIVITDGTGAAIQGGFTVAPAADIPRPMIPDGDLVGPRIRNALEARALASLEGGVWAYEAYLRLLAAASPSGEASTLENLVREDIARSAP